MTYKQSNNDVYKQWCTIIASKIKFIQYWVCNEYLNVFVGIKRLDWNDLQKDILYGDVVSADNSKI